MLSHLECLTKGHLDEPNMQLHKYCLHKEQGSQFFLSIKFQVISRFCSDQKCHSPGYGVNNFGTKKVDAKDVLKSKQYKMWTQLS